MSTIYNAYTGVNHQNMTREMLELESRRASMEEAKRIEEKVLVANLEKLKAEEQKAAFLRSIAEALRPVIRQELEAMATRIGNVVKEELAKGKIKPAGKPKHFAAADAKKAARVVKRLKANREARRKA